MRKGWLICMVLFSQALCSYQSGFAALKGDLSLFQPTSGLASSVYAYYDHNDGEYHDARIGEEVTVGYTNTAPLIDQGIRWTMNSYINYNAFSSAFVLSYGPVWLNPEAVSDYSITMSTTYSTECTIYFEKEIEQSIVTQLGLTIPVIPDIVGLSGGTKISNKATDRFGMSYTWGHSEVFSQSFTFDFSDVPSGYLCAPALLCNAVEIDLTWTVVDHWAWGIYPSRTPSQVNQNAHFVVIDPSTVYLGYVIKKVGDSGGPAYYRIA